MKLSPEADYCHMNKQYVFCNFQISGEEGRGGILGGKLSLTCNFTLLFRS